MQISLSKSSLIEKIVRDRQGRLVRATFCVYQNGYRVKARLVSVQYLDDLDETKRKVFFSSLGSALLSTVIDIFL